MATPAITVGAPATTHVGGKAWWAIAASSGLFFLLVMLPAALFSALGGGEQAAPGYPAASGIPEVYWPIYQAAAGHYRVSPYLIASIHQQETDFSRAQMAGVRSGVNSWGCCAGPTQLNITDGPPSTWDTYRDAYKPISGQRPDSYPQRRASHPSVYDDFDAMAATAAKLHADGATDDLHADGTFQAVCAYIGACSHVDTCGGPNSYCQVLPRAIAWQTQGAQALGAGVTLNLSGVPGKVILAAGADRAGVATHDAVFQFLAGVASVWGKPIVVTTGTQHSQESSSGLVSDHWTGDAADLGSVANGFASNGLEGTRLATAALVAAGLARERAYRLATSGGGHNVCLAGYRIQVIWRTGGHYDHVHVGVARRTECRDHPGYTGSFTL